MKDVDTLSGPPSNQNRRRRRAPPRQPNDNQRPSATTKYPPLEDYYDDDTHDDKGHRRNEDRMFNSSCPTGQFLLNPCLCLFNAAISCTKKWNLRQKKRMHSHSGNEKRRIQFLLSTAVIVIITFTFSWDINLPAVGRFLSLSSSAPSGRPLTDEALNQIPVTIGIFDFNGRDIGGWRSLRRFFHPTTPLDSSVIPPDFGGLDVLSIRMSKPGTTSTNNDKSNGRDAVVKDRRLSDEPVAPPRLIDPNDERLAFEEWEKLREDDPHQPTSDMHPEELEDKKRTCRAPSFHRKYLPTCNAIHEIKLYEDFDEERAKRPGDDQFYDSFYISHGAFRMVWILHQFSPVEMKSALKVTRYKKNWEPRYFWYTLNDAMVMEKLTGSPRIVNIYGHCGGTVWVEAMPHELEEIVVPGEGMAKQKDLPDIVKPKNDFKVEEKLDIALRMAESIADLHGFRDGVIVHDDVQLCQWLRTANGEIKLGDFNRAEVMEFNEKDKEYCEYYNGSCYGNYRAPEEYDKGYLNEKIDIFSFGNNIYGLLTGLWVFYDVDDDETVQKEVIKGTRAYINPQWRERSYIESELVKLMEKCWIPEPSERIDIFEAVKRLKEIKEENHKRKRDGTEW
eukprot:CAMPEP_0197185296 /NCGR_PEP_ID=MMETSP1423-20130617/11646_1 /TAXON_ID=476441 /ORGANISM="Pseudo-nitzschia heimii, Strain UNC1101" /LENGTH=617 /DNA_ID=CAMNT_0042636321 /DNA_START=147 /DNA_END=1997 /DNA_ORIENTATION=+